MKKCIVILVIALFTLVRPATAYYTNMPASVVVGQPDFTSNVGTVTGASFGLSPIMRGLSVDVKGRLIVTDRTNHRVLIWNTIPTENGKHADLVLGQPNFTSNAMNNGSISASSLSNPVSVYSDGDRLIVLDGGNDRVLIWNTFPTQNKQAADVVVGKGSMTAGLNFSCTASNLMIDENRPGSVWVDKGKLLVSTGSDQHRILIWNTVPTTNGVPADIVIGQSDLTSCVETITPTQRSVNSPRGIMVDPKGKLFVADLSSANRVLIWNTVPTQNNQPADVVVGQPNFTTNTPVLSPSGLMSPQGIFSNGERLFIGGADYRRLVIFNKIPEQNGASADIVLGQTDFHSSVNYGITSRSLNNAQMVFEYQNKLFVTEHLGSRILIFYNTIEQPILSLTNRLESEAGNTFKMYGNALVEAPYVLKNVEFAVNGGGWRGATAADGNFDETNEEYSFDFNKQENNQSKEGFVVQVKAKNNNTDEVDRLTYFEPFRQNTPENNVRIDNQLPSFSFTVNSQRQLLYEGLQKYMVMVKRGREDWKVYADEIPVNYDYAKDKADNTVEKKSNSNGNGIYEDSKIKVMYSEDGSRLEVYSKEDSKKLTGGSYQWKVVAVDKAGHNQETGTRYLRVKAGGSETWFPLTLDTISGVGKVTLSSITPEMTKSEYRYTKNNPTFSGVAFSGADISLELIDLECAQQHQQSCTQVFIATADTFSRYTLEVPEKTLALGKKYKVSLYATQEEKYVDLAPFNLTYGASTAVSQNNTSAVLGETTEATQAIKDTASAPPQPSLMPTQKLDPKQSTTEPISKTQKGWISYWWFALIVPVLFVILVWKRRKKKK